MCYTAAAQYLNLAQHQRLCQCVLRGHFNGTAADSTAVYLVLGGVVAVDQLSWTLRVTYVNLQKYPGLGRIRTTNLKGDRSLATSELCYSRLL